MEQPNSLCHVCLKMEAKVINLKTYNNKDGSILTKLQTIVPEVDWLEDYQICRGCKFQLDLAYNFRTRCILLESERKVNGTNIIIYVCFHCDNSFKNKDAVIEHIQTNHSDSIKTDKFYKITNEKVTPPETKSGVEDIKRIQIEHCYCEITEVANPETSRDNEAAQETKQNSVKKKRRQLAPRWKRKFSCKTCNTVLKGVKAMIEHCMTVHSMERKMVRPYMCNVCDKTFPTSNQWSRHKFYHYPDKQNMCSFCGRSFVLRSTLKDHEKSHLNLKTFVCQYCAKRFNVHQSLYHHIQMVHSDPTLWKHQCNVCSKKFPSNNRLIRHIKIHTGDKSIACNVCNKLFITKYDMNKHMKVHAVIKPLECDHCNRTYKSRKAMRKHIIRDHGIQPVSKVFSLECDQCGKKFSNKYYSRQHKRRVHKIQDEK